jgi:hypothetical protein
LAKALEIGQFTHTQLDEKMTDHLRIDEMNRDILMSERLPYFFPKKDLDNILCQPLATTPKLTLKHT